MLLEFLYLIYGGVNLHDWLPDKHSIDIRGKKWYYTRLTDMAVVNGYVIYKKIHISKLIESNILEGNIAVTYLKKAPNSKAILGRSVQRRQITSRSNVLPDIKFDKIQHVIGEREIQRHC